MSTYFVFNSKRKFIIMMTLWSMGAKNANAFSTRSIKLLSGRRIVKTSASYPTICTSTMRKSLPSILWHTRTNHCRPLHVMTEYQLELEISTIEEMEDVGAVLSVGSNGGDCLTLSGDLGAGKTCFSRGFVRASTGVMDLRVTSPTYLLSNTYPSAEGGLTIHHMDLYRLSEGKDFGPLNLPFVFTQCISLIEWPSRLGDLMPTERLEVVFQLDPTETDDDEREEKTRYLKLKPHGERWKKRIEEIEREGYLDDLIVEYEDD
mmetsp:Transcript_12093/g.18292  ORF Transcript_12093/g.18292 Transcript_12093/m.18292 type:complete len:262 (+) Transcript_12093:232-1017(+)